MLRCEWGSRVDKEVKLKIDGLNVSPETVPLPDLLDILRGFVGALTASATQAGVRKADIHVSLIGVDEGSDTLTLVANDATAFQASRLITAIAKDDSGQLPPAARRSVRRLWGVARRRQWTVCLESDIKGVKFKATIVPDVQPFVVSIVKGATSQLVYVVRAGGENPTAQVRLASGDVFTARAASKKVAESLGSHLYQWVEIVGEGQWNTKTWTFDDFRIDGIGEYLEYLADPESAVQKLTELSKGHWDRIDPTEYIRELRSDD